MCSIRVVTYTPDRRQEWNDFVARANNGTVFHDQDFLDYHPSDRFNWHHLLFYEGNTLVAVLPGGRIGDMFKSPTGASFGGFVVLPQLPIAVASEIVRALIRYCATQRIKEIYLTPPMQIYSKTFNEVLEYSLHYNHFIRLSSLYSSVIDFATIRNRDDLSRNTRHKVNKALNKGVTIEESTDFEAFYPILMQNKAKFGVTPTHTLQELYRIHELMPGMMTLFLARYEGQPVAGELLFTANPRCVLDFYTMHLYEHRNLFAVNLLIAHTIEWCVRKGFRFLDYGVSADTFSRDPMEPSWSLIVFKESMGATGCQRKTYYRRVF